MQPNRLSIIGVGLLGGSIGLAVKAAAMSCTVVGYGHRPATLAKAKQIGAIDESASTAAEAVKGADLVILCTPVGIFRQNLEAIAPTLTPGAFVTDVGSTKRSIVAQAKKILPKTVHFVGSHPMAGSEKRGVEFARADLFQSATCITTPTPDTNTSALQAVEAFWRTIGMRVAQLSPGDHDRLVCDVSHLPHALAAALLAMQSDDGLPLAGKGFLDSTRIASGDGRLWRDIFLDNRDNLRASATRLRERLDELLRLVETGDADAVRHWLLAAAQRRERLLQQKLRELSAD